MTIQEFENWYKEKRKRNRQDDWLSYKSKYLLKSMGLDFSNSEELISLTIETMLLDLNNIDKETVDSYVFFKMKNIMLNSFYHYNKKICCEGDFSEYYNIQEKEYSEENYHNQVKILNNRIENEDDKLVYNTLINGKLLKDLPFYGLKTTNIVRKLKGLEPLKNKKIKKSTGKMKGREKKYVGIKATNGTIVKYYSEIKHTKADGFTPELVRRCLTGQIKQHKEYKFTYNEKV